MKLTVKAVRKDGKFPASFFYQGGPNGFGGTFEGKRIGKLLTADQVKASVAALSSLDTLEDYTGQNLNFFRKDDDSQEPERYGDDPKPAFDGYAS